MTDINIIINIEGVEANRKKLKKLMPTALKESLDSAGVEVELQSAEEVREKLPAGFDKRFVVPEEVLVFPTEEGESDMAKKRRRRMKELNQTNRRKKIPGNTG